MYCAMCYAMCCIPQISIKHAHMHSLACDKKKSKEIKNIRQQQVFICNSICKIHVLL